MRVLQVRFQVKATSRVNLNLATLLYYMHIKSSFNQTTESHQTIFHKFYVTEHTFSATCLMFTPCLYSETVVIAPQPSFHHVLLDGRPSGRKTDVKHVFGLFGRFFGIEIGEQSQSVYFLIFIFMGIGGFLINGNNVAAESARLAGCGNWQSK